MLEVTRGIIQAPICMNTYTTFRTFISRKHPNLKAVLLDIVPVDLVALVALDVQDDE